MGPAFPPPNKKEMDGSSGKTNQIVDKFPFVNKSKNPLVVRKGLHLQYHSFRIGLEPKKSYSIGRGRTDSFRDKSMTLLCGFLFIGLNGFSVEIFSGRFVDL